MSDPQAELTAAKTRLSAAAARCLAEHDEQAAADADEALAEVNRITAEQQAHREES